MTNIEELKALMEEKGIKVSKAERVRSLLQKQKGLLKTKESLTDFKEPVLDLHRRNGDIETYEKATTGRFYFKHSNGQERYAELRIGDQETREYAGRRVKWYSLHEDRPYAGWEQPIVDGESVMIGYEKSKATDLKRLESLEKLRNKSKMTWVYIIIGIAVAFFIGAFAWGTWIAPALAKKATEQTATVSEIPKVALLLITKKWWKTFK